MPGPATGWTRSGPWEALTCLIPLPKLLLPYVEFSYFPEIIRNFDNANFQYIESAKIYDVHAGVHIRILPHESRVVPYGVVGFGVLKSETTGQSIPKPSFCSAQGLSPAQCSQLQGTVDINANDPTVNFGAGLRVYHTSYLGYRAEFKAYRPVSGQFTNFFYKAEGGIFFQFGGH